MVEMDACEHCNCSTAYILMEEREKEEVKSGNKGGGGVVNLTSLGHIEQFVRAVPGLNQFTRLGC
nr:hypothetical protein HmN_000313000 [Hymenolepis microstoma]